MAKKTLLIASLSVLALVSVAACGIEDSDSWHAVEYGDGLYQDERTAGQGVRYVRKNLARKKGSTLKPLMKQPKLLPRAEKLPPLRLSKRIELPKMTRPDLAVSVSSLMQESKIALEKLESGAENKDVINGQIEIVKTAKTTEIVESQPAVVTPQISKTAEEEPVEIIKEEIIENNQPPPAIIPATKNEEIYNAMIKQSEQAEQETKTPEKQEETATEPQESKLKKRLKRTLEEMLIGSKK